MSQTDMFKLDGKVAFIPGGSGGIGSALAAGLCEAGAQIAVVDRDDLGAQSAQVPGQRGPEPPQPDDRIPQHNALSYTRQG